MTPIHGRQTGRFSYDVPTGKWSWDDDVYRIHGLEPGSVQPTTDLVLDSKHPDDRDRVRALLEQASRVGGNFSISYRLIGADGRERRVVLVGESNAAGVSDDVTIEGYYIDLTQDFDEESATFAAAAVDASATSRAVIEQAKGALMFVYGLDSDQAFSMLRWWSSNRNIKVRDLATRLVELARVGQASDTELRSNIDALLHEITEPEPSS